MPSSKHNELFPLRFKSQYVNKSPEDWQNNRTSGCATHGIFHHYLDVHNDVVLCTNFNIWHFQSTPVRHTAANFALKPWQIVFSGCCYQNPCNGLLSSLYANWIGNVKSTEREQEHHSLIRFQWMLLRQVFFSFFCFESNTMWHIDFFECWVVEHCLHR